MRNKFDLTRKPKKEVRELVRQRDGFGCVVCGRAIYDYEHFNPEFDEARSHDPNGICLMCPTHHSTSTRHRLDKEQIARYAADPKCKQQGFARDEIFFDYPLTVNFGDITIRTDGSERRDMLKVGSMPVFSVEKMGEDRLVKFSAKLKDRENRMIFEITSNWIIVSSNMLDIRYEGAEMEIKDQDGTILLKFVRKSAHELDFEILNLFYNGRRIHFSKFDNILSIERPGENDLVVTTSEGNTCKSLTFQ